MEPIPEPCGNPAILSFRIEDCPFRMALSFLGYKNNLINQGRLPSVPLRLLKKAVVPDVVKCLYNSMKMPQLYQEG